MVAIFELKHLQMSFLRIYTAVIEVYSPSICINIDKYHSIWILKINRHWHFCIKILNKEYNNKSIESSNWKHLDALTAYSCVQCSLVNIRPVVKSSVKARGFTDPPGSGFVKGRMLWCEEAETHLLLLRIH